VNWWKSRCSERFSGQFVKLSTSVTNTDILAFVFCQGSAKRSQSAGAATARLVDSDVE